MDRELRRNPHENNMIVLSFLSKCYQHQDSLKVFIILLYIPAVGIYGCVSFFLQFNLSIDDLQVV